ncbi:MAG: penicillin-binding transpeptidase domain-containing protein [Bacteroidia bacterium]|nr:penicillin-binding transpeptidase domain-containing protein [Bacteroidia bacterium]MDW8235128.1 penicillin-binding transpeptidase domain-containing protein [Bacteroidia bacterium]
MRDRAVQRTGKFWWWVIGGTVAVFVLRLAQLQLFSPESRRQAQMNTIRRKEVLPPRGTLRDRKERLWVSNTPLFNIFITPKDVSRLDTPLMAQFLNVSPALLQQRVEAANQFSRTKPSLLLRYVSLPRYASLMEQKWRQTGLSGQLVHTRQYLYPIAAHVLGYLSEVTPREIAESQGAYTAGNLIGRAGIERQYERLLAGRKGYRFVVVDAMGRELYPYEGGIHDIPPVRGMDLVLSIDVELQQFAESLLQGKIGAIIAIEPATGEVLCSASSPSYDPNLLSGEDVGTHWNLLQRAPRYPLYNRAIQAMYPPGSLFKLANALIALQESTLVPAMTYPCAMGYIRNGGKPACHAHPSPLELVSAIQHSCNAYFASVFSNFLHHPFYGKVEVAYERWRDYMLYLGIGRRLGADIPGEKPGFLPTRAYYDRLYGKSRWNSLTIISNSIGQGEILMTPLQMANLMCIIANRGYYVQPHFLRYVYGQPHRRVSYFDTIRVPIDSVYFEVVIEGMAKAVEAGTGYSAHVPGLEICGKTGTAQNPHGADHSIFAGFAPKHRPRIAVAVVVENGGWGATWAAPIASLIIEKYLTGTTTRPHLVEYIKKTSLIPQ